MAGGTPHTDETWDTALSSGMMTTKLPAEVMDALYDAVVLRRVQVDETIHLVVGQADRATPTSIAENTAAEVHGALVMELAALRSPLHAESMFGSATVQAQRLVQRAAPLMLAAYGSKAGVTYVQSDDLMWDCFSGGLVARLALRYCPGFDEANSIRHSLEQVLIRDKDTVESSAAYGAVQLALGDVDGMTGQVDRAIAAWSTAWNQWQLQIDVAIQKNRPVSYINDLETRRDTALEPLGLTRQTTSQLLSEEVRKLEDRRRELAADPMSAALKVSSDTLKQATRDSWNRSRRLQMDAVVKAWLSEAGRAVQLDKKLATPGTVPMYELIQNVASSSQRMLSIAGPASGKPAIGPLMAGTSAPRVTRTLTSNDEAYAVMVNAEHTAARFEDQRSLRVPTGAVSDTIRRAMWASRRMDTDAMTALRNLPPGPDALVDRLAGLDIDDPRPAHYYCPVGSLLKHVPGKVPYGLDNHAQRVVWLRYVLEAIDVVKTTGSLVEQGGKNRSPRTVQN